LVGIPEMHRLSAGSAGAFHIRDGIIDDIRMRDCIAQ
jgi:hypothetical protein